MKVFAGISSFQMLAMFRRGLFYSFLTIYLRHFLGLSVTATTLFATVPMLLNVFCQRYVWGILSDKYQKRRLLIIGGEILGGIGTILLWYCHLIPDNKIVAGYYIIAGLSAIEIFWSMSNIGWSALISDLYDETSRGRVMGKLESLGGIGRMAGILIGGLFYDGFGRHYNGWGFFEGSLFFISAAVMFLSVFPMFLVPEGGVTPEEKSLKGSRPVDRFHPKIFYIFITAMAFIHFGRNSIAITMAQYLTLESGFHLSSITLSHVANIRSIAIVVTGLIIGMMTSRWGTRHVLTMGSLAGVLSLVILGISDQLAIICLSSYLMGFSEVAILAASYELASLYIPPEKRGTLFSIFNATLFLSWGIAATCIAGPITDVLIAMGKSEVFAYKVSFNTAAGITLIGVFVLIFLFRYEKK